MMEKSNFKGTGWLKRKYVKKDYDVIPHLQLKIGIIVVLGTITILLSVMYFLLIHYEVKNVIVEGNKHYSSKEIQDMVMTGYFGDNSLFLSMKYKNKEITDVPFVETMDVIVTANDTIKIMVYEKALAGYVEYLGRYMYFDNDGVVIEAAKMPTKGVPQVTGLSFEHIVLYEKIPVENDSIFQYILTITKVLSKYNVICDKIQFDANYQVTLGYDTVKVDIGKLENLDEKLMQLPYILPALAGERGTLDLQNYTLGKKSITFEKE